MKAANICAVCSRGLTWAEQKRQYGRALRAGLASDEAKRLMPRCQKCLTDILRCSVLQPLQPLRPAVRGRGAAASGT
jgi:hypothetical protein